MPSNATLIVAAAVAALAAAPGRAAQDTNDLFEMEVALRGAIQSFNRPQNPFSPNLVLDLSREKGE